MLKPDRNGNRLPFQLKLEKNKRNLSLI